MASANVNRAATPITRLGLVIAILAIWFSKLCSSYVGYKLISTD